MNEKKKFKDSRLGKFLKKAGSDIGNIAGDLLPDKGLLGLVKNLINKDVTMSSEQKKDALDMLKMEFEDVQNARDNETARDVSEHSSFLSKNIHEMIAIFVIGGWMTSWYFKPLIEYREITSAVMLILGYLYGRSKPQS